MGYARSVSIGASQYSLQERPIRTLPKPIGSICLLAKGMLGQIVSWSVRDESLHCEGIIRLFHEWHRETGAVTRAVRDDIIDVAKTMVGLEERFVDLSPRLHSQR